MRRRVLPKGIMTFVRRLIQTGVTEGAVPKLFAMVRTLGANPDDGHVVFAISLVLVNKGRNLGPAPGSPLTTIEEYDCGRSL